MQRSKHLKAFPSAKEDAQAAELCPPTPQSTSPSYRLSYMDPDFIQRDELRGVRLQLELMKPELLQQEHGIETTVVVFGSTRIPEKKAAAEMLGKARTAFDANPADPALARRVRIGENILAKARYYDEARKFAAIVSRHGQCSDPFHFVVITGGGPGIMEAANRGASDVGAKSIGLNIVLPFEQHPNPFVTPELSFQFHYFAIRKMHFLIRARALVAFPGGFGTCDELFEALTLVQTRKIKPVPIVLFGKAYWNRVINFEAMVEEGTISPGDLDIFRYAETAEEAWNLISDFYSNGNNAQG